MEEKQMRKIWNYRYLFLAVTLAITLVGCEGCNPKGGVFEGPTGITEAAPPPPPPVVKTSKKPVDVPPTRPEKAPQKPEKVLQLKIVYFDYDKYNLRPDTVAILNNNLNYLRAYPDKYVKVIGHCDERGSEQYNQALGEKRALSVRSYLIQKGIAADRLVPESRGESQHVDLGHNEAAWAKNRRVEFEVWK
jgi:peptidoglycan-associated lipoprotein